MIGAGLGFDCDGCWSLLDLNFGMGGDWLVVGSGSLVEEGNGTFAIR